jgi:hypothetical protein
MDLKTRFGEEKIRVARTTTAKGQVLWKEKIERG